MRYISDRGVYLLVLLACVSVLLACASGILGWQALAARREARAVVARADSLIADWIKRGCAPKSQALP